MTSTSSLVASLLNRGHVGRAIRLLEIQLRAQPDDLALRHQLAGVLAVAGRAGEAVPILQGLADDLARHGLAAQAIAAAKQAQALDPGQPRPEERLATLIEDRGLSHEREATGEAPAPDEGMQRQLLDAVGEALREDAAARPPDLVRTPLFEDFSREELIEVMRGLKLLTFEPGDVVVTEGEPGESLFVVTSGRVKAFVRRPSGQSAKVRELAEGDFFGEVSVLQGGRRTATITCATKCDLLELDKPTLDAIAARHPRVLRVMQSFCDQRAGSTLEHMIRGV